MREKRQGRSVEETSAAGGGGGGGWGVGGCTQRQTKNIKKQSDTQERERRLEREVQIKNGGCDCSMTGTE